MASEGTVELYSHGNGRVGVMVEVNCETDFVARSESFRTLRPRDRSANRGISSTLIWLPKNIPAEVLEHEREIARSRALEEGKPDSILPTIVEGRIEKFKDEVCLLRQPYIRDETITVEQLLLQNVAAIGEIGRHPAVCPLGVRRRGRIIRTFTGPTIRLAFLLRLERKTWKNP